MASRKNKAPKAPTGETAPTDTVEETAAPRGRPVNPPPPPNTGRTPAQNPERGPHPRTFT